MAVEQYSPTDRIVHITKVDFKKQIIISPIRVVQYDNNLPVVEAELYMNDILYTLPMNASVKIRWGKKDHTFIIKEVLGCNQDRTKVYFEIDNQMTYFYGEATPILVLVIDGKTAGSSYIYFVIDRNPVQATDIESTTEYPDLESAVAEAQEAASDAEQYKNDAKDIADQALIDISDTKDQSIIDISVAKEQAIAEVAAAKDWVEVGTTGQTTPSTELIVGGIFYEKLD